MQEKKENRGGDVRDARAWKRWSDEQHDVGKKVNYSIGQERSDEKDLGNCQTRSNRERSGDKMDDQFLEI
jgi:hypothetical protein